MLGVSSSGGLLGSSGDSMASVAPTTHEGGGGGGGGSNSNMFMEEDKSRIEESDRSSAGNRWPRQETMALLQIRSDMDAAFRDSSLKGPLWEEVSRKLAELGYHRSAKKCKEKFENVYKYHKRTKDGRATKSDGKAYRFFEQLEALDRHHANSLPLLLPPPQHHPNSVPLLPPPQKPQIPVVAGGGVSGSTNATCHVSQVIVPSIPNPTINTTTATTTTISRNLITPPTNPTIRSPPPPLTNPTFSSQPVSNPSHPTYNPTISSPPLTHFSQQIKNPTNPSQTNIPSSFPNMPENLVSNSISSSTSSDEHFQRRHKRKRKWTEFFEKLMNEVIEKQEELQKKFLEAIEKREHDRMVREEAWKMQEMARMNREHEILVQERSMAAAKDAAVIAFLQKISSEQQNPMHGKMNDNSVPVLPQPQPLQPPQPTQPQSQQQQALPPPQPPSQVKTLDIMKLDNCENYNSVLPTSSSRWPKAEVQALIQLRTTLDLKYQETGPKGPLWEEISSGMRKMGYNRNAKRCKEKWENINKYFKKVKESNKQRPEDSKTCPYFHLLDAVYKERNKMGGAGSSSYHHQSYGLNRQQESTNANMVAMMVQPEQQWPVQRDQSAVMEDMGSENMDQNHEEDDESEDDEEEDGGSYEIVSNKPSSMGGVE